MDPNKNNILWADHMDTALNELRSQKHLYNESAGPWSCDWWSQIGQQNKKGTNHFIRADSNIIICSQSLALAHTSRKHDLIVKL